jgi:arylsulfatase
MLAAAGAEIRPEVDGRNILPALRAEAPLAERPWFSYVHQGADAHASVHLGNWKLVAHGDFFAENPATPPALELYDLASDPTETKNLTASHPEKVADLHRRLREFGTWQKAGVANYDAGRKGFVAPNYWRITD